MFSRGETDGLMGSPEAGEVAVLMVLWEKGQGTPDPGMQRGEDQKLGDSWE